MSKLLLLLFLVSTIAQAKFKWTVIHNMSGDLVTNENLTFDENKDYIYQNNHFLCKMTWKNISSSPLGRTEVINVGCSSKKQSGTSFSYRGWCAENKNKKNKSDGGNQLEINLTEKLEAFTINFICQV
jgi:hypothetical protein